MSAISRDVILLVAGAGIGITLEHGWGWVLAWLKARAARVKTQASDLYAEMQSQVGAAVKAEVMPLASRLTAVEAGLADIRNKPQA